MSRPVLVACATRRVAPALVFALLGASPLVPAAHAAQGTPPTPAQLLTRGFDHEDAGRLDSAAAYFRRALATPERVQALLGLERVYALQGRQREIVPVADSVIAAGSDEATVLGVKVRGLVAPGDRAALRETLDGWSRRHPRDAEPWREAVRALLDAGQPLAADTLAELAASATGARRGVAAELGQVRARLGRWEPAAASFREALLDAPYLVDAAVWALRQTPADRRPTTIAALLLPPVSASARRAAGALQGSWGDYRGAWDALRGLPRSDSTALEWQRFAEGARRGGAAAIAVEAWVSALEVRRSAPVALDAAESALEAGNAVTALDLLEVAVRAPDTSGTASRLAVLRTRGLAANRRLPEAAAVVSALEEPLARRRAAAALAEGYALAGDLAGAARVADAEGLEVEDDASAAWVALWRGDLVAARRGVSALAAGPRPAVQATALAARTRGTSSPAFGAAFLALARRDTVAARQAFLRAATELPDIAAALRLEAARLAVARGDAAGAEPLWAAIIAADATAPEAAEARLARARARLRAGRPGEARGDLEALILEQPWSALVPQARRELERLAGRVP